MITTNKNSTSKTNTELKNEDQDDNLHCDITWTHKPSVKNHTCTYKMPTPTEMKCISMEIWKLYKKRNSEFKNTLKMLTVLTFNILIRTYMVDMIQKSTTLATITEFFGHYPSSSFYLKQRLGGWTLPPSSVTEPVQLGPIGRTSLYLCIPELTTVRYINQTWH
jgi:hypothetical protein